MSCMRATTHNGRKGKHGVYSAKHNDRNFDITKADHIDQERTSGNWYWHKYQSRAPELTFEQVEAKYYEDTFKRSLEAKNERYRASGHKERMKTIEEYRKNRLSCPEETILQVGKAGDTIDHKLLQKICIEHMNWEMKTFPNVKLLDVALHVDEQGAPHMHERKVWIAHSKDGLVVGQNKALEEMGIPLPDPKKARNRHNNAKMTYDATCRKHFLDTCRKYGLEIEQEPDRASKKGLELIEYQRQQALQGLQQAQEAHEALQRELIQAENELTRIRASTGSERAKRDKVAEDIAQLEKTAKNRLESLREVEKQLQEVIWDKINYDMMQEFIRIGNTINEKGEKVYMQKVFDEKFKDYYLSKHYPEQKEQILSIIDDRQYSTNIDSEIEIDR